jgi:hypothetical protein
MKFYIRRAIAGIVAIPFVAGAWVFFYLLLLLAGAEPSQSISDTFHNGVLIGFTVAVMFTFAPQVAKILAKVSGE